eukprot:TRINITY_DN18872_c0_g1_i4.p1 TRINITY_DN18872_c0_g1~~TRINITY_DN18872_c0_g1_i4.p1  ORF type:complete len:2672 (-),score=534.34 TRINITY_DN18872_c0_g1_i4:460-8475(-)
MSVPPPGRSGSALVPWRPAGERHSFDAEPLSPRKSAQSTASKSPRASVQPLTPSPKSPRASVQPLTPSPTSPVQPPAPRQWPAELPSAADSDGEALQPATQYVAQVRAPSKLVPEPGTLLQQPRPGKASSRLGSASQTTLATPAVVAQRGSSSSPVASPTGSIRGSAAKSGTVPAQSISLQQSLSSSQRQSPPLAASTAKSSAKQGGASPRASAVPPQRPSAINASANDPRQPSPRNSASPAARLLQNQATAKASSVRQPSQQKAASASSSSRLQQPQTASAKAKAAAVRQPSPKKTASAALLQNQTSARASSVRPSDVSAGAPSISPRGGSQRQSSQPPSQPPSPRGSSAPKAAAKAPGLHLRLEGRPSNVSAGAAPSISPRGGSQRQSSQPPSQPPSPRGSSAPKAAAKALGSRLSRRSRSPSQRGSQSDAQQLTPLPAAASSADVSPTNRTSRLSGQPRPSATPQPKQRSTPAVGAKPKASPPGSRSLSATRMPAAVRASSAESRGSRHSAASSSKGGAEAAAKSSSTKSPRGAPSAPKKAEAKAGTGAPRAVQNVPATGKASARPLKQGLPSSSSYGSRDHEAGRDTTSTLVGPRTLPSDESQLQQRASTVSQEAASSETSDVSSTPAVPFAGVVSITVTPPADTNPSEPLEQGPTIDEDAGKYQPERRGPAVGAAEAGPYSKFVAAAQRDSIRGGQQPQMLHHKSQTTPAAAREIPSPDLADSDEERSSTTSLTRKLSGAVIPGTTIPLMEPRHGRNGPFSQRERNNTCPSVQSPAADMLGQSHHPCFDNDSCSRCGNVYMQDASYCPKCGTPRFRPGSSDQPPPLVPYWRAPGLWHGGGRSGTQSPMHSEIEAGQLSPIGRIAEKASGKVVKQGTGEAEVDDQHKDAIAQLMQLIAQLQQQRSQEARDTAAMLADVAAEALQAGDAKKATAVAADSVKLVMKDPELFGLNQKPTQVLLEKKLGSSGSDPAATLCETSTDAPPNLGDDAANMLMKRIANIPVGARSDKETAASRRDLLGQVQQKLDRQAKKEERYPLIVTIVAAKDLRDADIGDANGTSSTAQGHSDPYVLCNVCGKDGSIRLAFNTATIMETLSPVWNHEEWLDGFGLLDSLNFFVFDDDGKKSADLLGTAVLKGADFLHAEGGRFEGQLVLDDEESRKKASAQVTPKQRGKKSPDENLKKANSEATLVVRIEVGSPYKQPAAPLPQIDKLFDITIIAAKALRNADRNAQRDASSKGKSDAFVIGEVIGKPELCFKTKVIKDSLDPVWNHRVGNVKLSMGDALEFNVYDDDGADAGPGDFLGIAVASTNDFFEAGFSGSLKIFCSGATTESELSVKIQEVGAREPRPWKKLTPKRLESTSKGLPYAVCFNIKGAKDLSAAKKAVRKASRGDVCDPYVICRVGAQMIRTKSLSNTEKPMWNHHVCLPDYDSGEAILFELYDADGKDASRDQPIGTATIVCKQFMPGGFIGGLPVKNTPKGGKSDAVLMLDMMSETDSKKATALQAAAKEGDQVLTVSKSIGKARDRLKIGSETHLIKRVGEGASQGGVIIHIDTKLNKAHPVGTLVCLAPTAALTPEDKKLRKQRLEVRKKYELRMATKDKAIREIQALLRGVLGRKKAQSKKEAKKKADSKKHEKSKATRIAKNQDAVREIQAVLRGVLSRCQTKMQREKLRRGREFKAMKEIQSRQHREEEEAIRDIQAVMFGVLARHMFATLHRADGLRIQKSIVRMQPSLQRRYKKQQVQARKREQVAQAAEKRHSTLQKLGKNGKPVTIQVYYVGGATAWSGVDDGTKRDLLFERLGQASSGNTSGVATKEQWMEYDWACSVIQRRYRGVSVHEEARERRLRRKQISKPNWWEFDDSLDGVLSYLQALCRGMLARKYAKQVRTLQADEQALDARIEKLKLAADMSHEAGRDRRQQMADLLREEEEAARLAEEAEQQSASSLIQGRLRGKKARIQAMFLRRLQMASLMQEDSICELQAACRGLLARELKKDKQAIHKELKHAEAALVVQSRHRRNLARLDAGQLRERRQAVSVIQGRFRSKHAKSMMKGMRVAKQDLEEAVLLFQCRIRRWLARVEYKRLRVKWYAEEEAILELQRFAHGVYARELKRRMMLLDQDQAKADERIKALQQQAELSTEAGRERLRKMEELELEEACLVIQCRYRGKTLGGEARAFMDQKRRELAEEIAIADLQAMIRGLFARIEFKHRQIAKEEREAAKAEMEQQQRREQEAKEAEKRRQRMAIEDTAIEQVQSILRVVLARRRYQEALVTDRRPQADIDARIRDLQEKAELSTESGRARHAMIRQLELEEACLVIQSRYRGVEAKGDLLFMKRQQLRQLQEDDALCIVQALCRGVLARCLRSKKEVIRRRKKRLEAEAWRKDAKDLGISDPVRRAVGGAPFSVFSASSSRLASANRRMWRACVGDQAPFPLGEQGPGDELQDDGDAEGRATGPSTDHLGRGGREQQHCSRRSSPPRTTFDSKGAYPWTESSALDRGREDESRLAWEQTFLAQAVRQRQERMEKPLSRSTAIRALVDKVEQCAVDWQLDEASFRLRSEAPERVGLRGEADSPHRGGYGGQADDRQVQSLAWKSGYGEAADKGGELDDFWGRLGPVGGSTHVAAGRSGAATSVSQGATDAEGAVDARSRPAAVIAGLAEGRPARR